MNRIMIIRIRVRKGVVEILDQRIQVGQMDRLLYLTISFAKDFK